MRHVNRILTYGEGITIRYLKGEMNGIVDTLKREISKRVYTRKYVVNIKANKEKSEIIVVNKINISEINEEEETFAEKNEKAEDSNFFIEDLNYESVIKNKEKKI
uniref:Reverse transcriptase domain-containing protein n=1 Tax=Strongyloides stercoralis TaxID=6248 RepID=A0A0K0DRZ9_STRER